MKHQWLNMRDPYRRADGVWLPNGCGYEPWQLEIIGLSTAHYFDVGPPGRTCHCCGCHITDVAWTKPGSFFVWCIGCS